MDSANVPKISAEYAEEKVSDKKTFLTVGIGASAGGIGALKEFFAAMPDKPGMAFVVILHLSQEHESSLAQILQNQTSMRVEQVTETVKVEPNNVYVIPPAKHLEMIDGMIALSEPERIRGRRVPIDLFFRTLADAHGKNGIAVVLSGTGSDGTLGLKRVKESGGIGIAQDPAEAEYDGMPRSAINTGLVDLILPVGEMPERIIGLRDNGDKIRLPKEKDEIPRTAKGKEPDALNEILAIVRVRTGHDFTAYKHATVLRRIARRLQVHALEGLPAYLDFLREHPDEAGQLQRDLLITVTNFFRDKEAFEVLEKEIIPKLFAGKTSADTVRVWSVGCATGEEAYSVAILLDEFASRITDAPKIQIFASDINEEAIARGRECFYEEPIAADVSPERLRHYFAKENGGYRVRKELRETVLFAPHNILRDPPFSKLDLITCRNLLIYFNRETQEKVLGIFNFALRRDGYLFLGASESAESLSALFAVADKKHRIYRARPQSHHQTLPALPERGRWNVRIPQLPIETNDAPTKSYGEIHLQLVEQFAPPSVLVNEDYEIVHVSENAGRFLRVAGGEPTRDLLKLVHSSLKLDLQSALFEVKKGGGVSESRNVRFDLGFGIADLGFEEEINQQSAIENRKSKNPKSQIRNPKSESLVNITVRLINAADSTDGFYLVIFDESKAEAAPEEIGQKPQTVAGRDAVDEMMRHLEKELQTNRERLRVTIEHNETSSEELKASNEELQAMNEELRSASEELETSKEELQSLNEELMTVNAELKDKVEETIRVNSDLQNLVQSTDIGTIFLDRALRVKRYTPRVAELFNIIPSDVGRPLEHLTHKFDEDFLTEDAGEVLKTLHLKEREVRGGAGDKRYLVRLAPYRTIEDKIDGVVLSFQDITDLKRAGDLLLESEEQYRAIISQNLAGIAKLDLDGKVIFVNDRFCGRLGYTCDEMLEMQIGDFVHPEDLPESLKRLEHLKDENQPFEIEKRLVRKDGSIIWVQNNESPITDADGKVRSVAIISIDITERKQIEQALQRSEAQFRNLLENLPAAAYTCNAEGLITYFNQRAVKLWGREPKLNDETDKFCGSFKLFAPDGTPISHDLCWMALAIQNEKSYDGHEIVIERPDGSHFTALAHANPIHDQSGTLVGAVNVLVNITDRKQTEEALRQSENQLQLVTDAMPVLISYVDAERRYRFVNQTYQDWFGHAPEEIIGKHVREIVGEAAYDEVLPAMDKVLSGEALQFERLLPYQDGGSRFVSVNYTPDKDETGAVNGFYALIEDVSQRKQAEEDLQASEENFRNLANSMSPLAWTCERLGDVDWYNNRWLDYTGLSFDEMKDWGWKQVQHPDHVERVVAGVQRSRETGEIWKDTFPLRGADGEYRWFLSRALPIRDKHGKVVRWFGTNTDIEDLRLAEEKLKDADRRKDEFLATLAHELRNPLAPIRTALEIMRRGDDKEKEQKSQKIIERQLAHIVRLVDDLLDVSRITQGKIELQPERLELRTVIEMAVETTRTAIDVAGHELEIRLPDEPVFLDADPVRLSQIFLNLLSNAAKYCEPNGKISIIAETGDNRLAVCVKDSGFGIAPDKLPHIFGMFTQIERSAQRGQGGLGIGLSLVKSLTEMHGGTVEAESEGEGKGCTFTVRLPLAENQKPKKSPKKQIAAVAEKPVSPAKPNRRKILVVDDNRDGAEMMRVWLTLNGHEVHTAFDGKTAVKTAARFKPEICLLDIGLPDISGYEVARQIRQKLPSALLVALTGWGQDEDRQRAKDAGFDVHLVKPVEIEAVEELLLRKSV